jgi:hypothetical protein
MKLLKFAAIVIAWVVSRPFLWVWDWVWDGLDTAVVLWKELDNEH